MIWKDCNIVYAETAATKLALICGKYATLRQWTGHNSCSVARRREIIRTTWGLPNRSLRKKMGYSGEIGFSMEITSYSPVASVIAVYCLMTIGINIFVCYYIYRKRCLRTSCTALIVANLAAVDVLVSIKDLPLLISVSTTGRWYFEEHWCRSYGLTNVIYIIVAISTLVTITTEQYFRLTESQKSQGNSSRSLPLGYIIAHTTLSYSLSLLWSKYVFISRKAFCEVDWPPSGLGFTLITSCIFLIPVSLLIYNFFGNDSEDDKNSSEKAKLVKLESGENEESDEDKAHSRLQFAICTFLVTWSPYVIESFVTYSSAVPNIVGVVCAFIPIVTTTLIPLWYIKWRRTADKVQLFSSYHIQNC